MAAIPPGQSGLLAEALKFTGALTCDPFAGDVTVTTGVLAEAKELKQGRLNRRTAGNTNRKHRTGMASHHKS
jgi:hypothetical protein